MFDREYEQEFAEYLDDLVDLPTGHSFAVLLKKGDPIAYEVGFSEWEAEHYPEDDTCIECGDALMGDEETLCSSCEEYARKAKP